MIKWRSLTVYSTDLRIHILLQALFRVSHKTSIDNITINALRSAAAAARWISSNIGKFCP